MRSAYGDRYRVAARPATFVVSTEVIVEDLTGRRFLLNRERAELQVLSLTELATLGTFFEPSQDCVWRTIADLRRLLCDACPSTSTTWNRHSIVPG